MHGGAADIKKALSRLKQLRANINPCYHLNSKAFMPAHSNGIKYRFRSITDGTPAKLNKC